MPGGAGRGGAGPDCSLTMKGTGFFFPSLPRSSKGCASALRQVTRAFESGLCVWGGRRRRLWSAPAHWLAFELLSFIFPAAGGGSVFLMQRGQPGVCAPLSVFPPLPLAETAASRRGLLLRCIHGFDRIVAFFFFFFCLLCLHVAPATSHSGLRHLGWFPIGFCDFWVQRGWRG